MHYIDSDTMPYIDLDRRFGPLKEDDDPETWSTPFMPYWADPAGGMTWAELLKNPFVVVLGEAGSGKTREFKAQGERIRHEQRLAFIVRAEDLVNGELSHALNPDDHEILQTWRDRNDEAVFFVDAVDEAKIAHHANVFDKVLKALRRDLRDATSRARFVISCRVSDWSPQADLSVLKEFIRRCRPAADGQVPEPSLVTLLPLDPRRAREFAEALGVADINAFMAAVEQAGLEAYCTRPRDVDWLVSFWQQRNHFGSLTEMIEVNIEERLRELNPGRTTPDLLSTDRARAGAEVLAAAVTLGKTFTIALPHFAAQLTEVGRSVSAEHALRDWRRAEIDFLLTRAVFDPATQGRVRFHHRSTQEYLAACWLVERQEQGVPFDRIRDLVIREAYGTEYAVPSMGAVAGWLAVALRQLRRDLIDVAPEILVFEGDASQLPIEDREATLRALASRIRSGMRLPWGYGGSPYHRFADPRLAPLIVELLQSERDQIHTIDLLLRLVEAGRLAACADAALGIARDETNESGTRALAIRAAAAAGNHQTRQALRDLACLAVTLEEYVAFAFFDALFPVTLDAKQCVEIAKKLTKPLPPYRSYRFKQSMVERCPPSQLPALLEGLLDLASQKPMVRSDGILSKHITGVISQQFAWSADAIYAVLKRLHACDAIAADAAELIARAYERLLRCQDLLTTGRLPREPDASVQWPVAIRKAIFRRIAASVNDLGFLSVVLVWWNKGLFRLTEPDLAWLVNEISAVDDPPKKTDLFELILDVWRDAGRPKDRVTAIRAALESCNPDDNLRRLVEQRLAPPSTEEPEWKKPQREADQQQEQQEREQLTRNKRELELRIQWLRDATDVDALAWCYEWMHDSHRDAGWTNLERDFGTEIAKAVRDGFKALWRLWWPLLPFEKPEPNRTAVAVYLGLAGLELAFAEGADGADLTPDEAEAACRYALHHLNGFPEWFEELAAAHPEVVARVVSRQLRAELGPDRPSDTFAFTLSAVRDGPEKVRRLCTPTIAEELEQAIPGSRHALKYALEIVIRSGEAAQRTITNLASRALQAELAPVALGTAVLVLAAWLQVDPDAALKHFQRQRQVNIDAAKDLFLALASHFGGDWRHKTPLRTETWSAQILERLVRLSLAYIDPAEDKPRREGSYSPDARDYAEDFRRWVINLLGKREGRDAHDALHRLADATELPQAWRDQFKATAEAQAENATERPPWSENQVIEFADLHERDPATAEELFRIALDRLKDIKDDIEKGDFSDRGLFRPRMDETDMQKWLAGRLQRESRRRYNVVREAEVDQRKKPDIRLYDPRTGYVSVEIKPVEKGDRYTYNELVGALENQLVGQYMRAAGSRHGVLVIGMLEVRRWDPGDGSDKIDFAGLIERLNERGAALVRTRSDIDALQVIGIDFSRS